MRRLSRRNSFRQFMATFALLVPAGAVAAVTIALTRSEWLAIVAAMATSALARYSLGRRASNA